MQYMVKAVSVLIPFVSSRSCDMWGASGGVSMLKITLVPMV